MLLMLFKSFQFPKLIVLLAKQQTRRTSGASNNRLKQQLNNILLKMPKEKQHIQEAQKQRQKIKEKGMRYTPGTVNLQILGSGAPGAPASVYLFTDQSRYLFNCGEGTQRLAHEHKAKLARLEHIFMTRTSWKRFGGLPGLSLTIQDAGVPNITLHGPSGLDEIFNAMRRFVILRDLKVEYVDCESGGQYEDAVMTVQYVPLRRNSSSRHSKENSLPSPEVDNTDYYAHENKEKASQAFSQANIIDYTKREESAVMAYICKLKPRPGSLNLEKCVDKGVPAGPLLGQLKNGIDIILPNETVVRAEDVRGPNDPGPVFIFIDIPNKEYLKSLVESNSAFQKYQSTATNDDEVASVVVHFSPQHIIEADEYRNFVNKFAPSTKHLILNSSNIFSGYVAAHRIQWQLNQINEHIFPILKENMQMQTNLEENYCNQNKKLKLEDDIESNDKTQLENISELTLGTNNSDDLYMDHVNPMSCYHLRPRKGLDRDSESRLNPSEYIDETHAINGFTSALQEVKSELNNRYQAIRETLFMDYPRILFLGTGSCIPNKTRNVSAILIHTNENSCILLDCGEGTWGQIVRFYGKSRATEVLRNLKAIYVSHLHADHHIGLIGILQKRQDLFKDDVKPVLLLAPKQISSWLYFYDRRIETIHKTYSLIPNSDMMVNPMDNEQTAEMGLRSIATCLVRHCPHSFGISLTIDSGNKTNDDHEPIKITYSGDTMPCEDLVELGRNSTVLIHEATMEDELIAEAKIKMHSTVTQAIEQCLNMNAKYVLLTHFSQRYAKLPRIESSLGDNIGIAFDNMEVTLNDIRHLSLMYPTLKIMFSGHCDEMEQKAIKRALKRERNKQVGKPASPVR